MLGTPSSKYNVFRRVQKSLPSIHSSECDQHLGEQPQPLRSIPLGFRDLFVTICITVVRFSLPSSFAFYECTYTTICSFCRHLGCFWYGNITNCAATNNFFMSYLLHLISVNLFSIYQGVKFLNYRVWVYIQLY